MDNTPKTLKEFHPPPIFLIAMLAKKCLTKILNALFFFYIPLLMQYTPVSVYLIPLRF